MEFKLGVADGQILRSVRLTYRNSLSVPSSICILVIENLVCNVRYHHRLHYRRCSCVVDDDIDLVTVVSLEFCSSSQRDLVPAVCVNLRLYFAISFTYREHRKINHCARLILEHTLIGPIMLIHICGQGNLISIVCFPFELSGICQERDRIPCKMRIGCLDCGQEVVLLGS